MFRSNVSRNFSSSILPGLVKALDMGVVFLSGTLSLWIRGVMNLPIDLPDDLGGYYAVVSVGALLYGLISSANDQAWRGRHLAGMFVKVVGQWLMVPLFLLLWLFPFKSSHELSRLWFLLWMIVAALNLCVFRFLVYYVLKIFRRRGFNQKNVAVIGAGVMSEQIMRKVRESSWTGYRLHCHLDNPSDAELKRLATEPLDEVWLALPLDHDGVLERTLHTLRHTTASIRFVPDLFTLSLVNHGLFEVLGFPMFTISATPMSGFNLWVKWLEDKMLAAVIVMLVSPLMLVLALGVKASSPGPVFYRQTRIGLNNRPFEMLKFRSMPTDSEGHGVIWGGADRKVTNSFGRFIRRTSLDELPQFLNVLKGDMSIVGPRPERPMFVEQFKDEIPNYMKKHLVKAGITGWAQIHGWRGDTDLEMRIRYDLYYIEHWSLWLDLKIIFLTLLKVFRDESAR